MYYTVIEHDGHLRTRRKCRNHEPQASVFFICSLLVFLHLLYQSEVMWQKNNKTRFFFVLCPDKTGFRARAGCYLYHKRTYVVMSAKIPLKA